MYGKCENCGRVPIDTSDDYHSCYICDGEKLDDIESVEETGLADLSALVGFSSNSIHRFENKAQLIRFLSAKKGIPTSELWDNY